jgi:arsenate reductase (thioredoxin)
MDTDMTDAREPRVYNVLFLCTGNSARSILAEAALNRRGEGRFRAWSAGSFPKGEVNPDALRVLERLEYSTEGLRSKSWDEFTSPDAPQMDIIITVCDDAAGETCPVWPGHPLTAHWGLEDPSHVQGNDVERERAFVTTLRYIENRINLMMSLPIEAVDQLALKAKLRAIGRSEGASSGALASAEPLDVVIYHNPDCGTSRNTLAMIRNAGIEPHIVEYLKSPPAREMLIQLIERAGLTPRALLREKGTPYADLGLGNEHLSDAALIEAMMAHPVLINRPLVATPLGVRLCRPSELVLDILPEAQRGGFIKEDGEQVVDEHGKRIPA